MLSPGWEHRESRKSCRKCDGLNNNALDNNNPTGSTADAVAAGESAAGDHAVDRLIAEQVSVLEFVTFMFQYLEWEGKIYSLSALLARHMSNQTKFFVSL